MTDQEIIESQKLMIDGLQKSVGALHFELGRRDAKAFTTAVAEFEGYIDGETPMIKWLGPQLPVGTKFYAPPSVQGESIDSEIERLALIHVAPLFGKIGTPCNYQDTDQFKRLKAYTLALLDVLLARTAAPSAQQLDARYAEGYGDGWKEGRADLPAAPSEGLAIPTWQERRNADRDGLKSLGLNNSNLPVSGYMMQEIADLRAALTRAPATEQAKPELAGLIADIVQKLIGEGVMDWRSTGPEYEGGDDDGFNSNDDERACLLHHVRAILAAQPVPQATQAKPSAIVITLRQAERLVKFFGGHDSEVTVTERLEVWATQPEGLYVFCTDQPGEGVDYLGPTEVDDDLAVNGRAVPQASGERDVWEMELELYRVAYGPLAPSEATIDVLAERRRQVEQEGWTPAHDDAHSNGDLAAAAVCYAMENQRLAKKPLGLWPWDLSWWKPKDGRRNLVKAGALIIAEIERLDRKAESSAATTSTPPAEEAPCN